MIFACQKAPLAQLELYASSHRHSILIEGPPGCGKTYMALQYAKMLGVADFHIVDPTVQAIRDAIDECYKVDTDVVLCIENLDKGVASASYTILKFLEEPTSNIYIVVTCRNMNRVPDTIISRSVSVNAAPPIDTDIDTYAKSKDAKKFDEISGSLLWRCVRTFGDADIVMHLNSAQLEYFQSLQSLAKFRDPVSQTSWALQHYSDNSETPIELVIRYLMEICDSATVKSAGISCLSDISAGRVAAHAAVARFVLDCKYLE